MPFYRRQGIHPYPGRPCDTKSLPSTPKEHQHRRATRHVPAPYQAPHRSSPTMKRSAWPPTRTDPLLRIRTTTRSQHPHTEPGPQVFPAPPPQRVRQQQSSRPAIISPPREFARRRRGQSSVDQLAGRERAGASCAAAPSHSIPRSHDLRPDPRGDYRHQETHGAPRVPRVGRSGVGEGSARWRSRRAGGLMTGP